MASCKRILSSLGKGPARRNLLGQGEAQRVEGLAATTGRVRVGPLHRGKENIPCTPEKYGANLQNLEKTPAKKENKEENRNHNENRLKRKQTNLTDFNQAQKRVVGTLCKSGQVFQGTQSQLPGSKQLDRTTANTTSLRNPHAAETLGT